MTAHDLVRSLLDAISLPGYDEESDPGEFKYSELEAAYDKALDEINLAKETTPPWTFSNGNRPAPAGASAKPSVIKFPVENPEMARLNRNERVLVTVYDYLFGEEEYAGARDRRRIKAVDLARRCLEQTSEDKLPAVLKFMQLVVDQVKV